MSAEFARVSVSVMIPCFNAERWITETLASVQQQTLPREQIEVIVVDDGSTDGSVARIHRCGLPGLKLLRTRNLGASQARNLGTAESTGKYLQYLDADDVLRPDALRQRVETLEATGADVAYTAWQKLVENEQGDFLAGETVRRRIEDVSADTELALFSSFWAPPAALLYRREIVERIGGWNADYPVIQDARFLQDAAHCGAVFAYVDEVLADYRKHRRASLSTTSFLQFEKDIFFNNQETEDRWLRAGTLTAARRAYLCQTYRRSAAFFFWNFPDLFEPAYRRSTLARGTETPSLVDGYAWLAERWGVVAARRFLLPWRALGERSRGMLRSVAYRDRPARGVTLENPLVEEQKRAG